MGILMTGDKFVFRSPSALQSLIYIDAIPFGLDPAAFY